MSVFRAVSAIHFPLYLTALALTATVAVLHVLLEYRWVQSMGYGTLMISGFWMSQGLSSVINRVLGYSSKSRSGSVD